MCAAGSRHFVGLLIEQGNYAIVMGKDCKASYQAVSAVSINYYLYKTK